MTILDFYVVHRRNGSPGHAKCSDFSHIKDGSGTTFQILPIQMSETKFRELSGKNQIWLLRLFDKAYQTIG
jgi:hypothetical protein